MKPGRRTLTISYGLSALLHGGLVTALVLAVMPARRLPSLPPVETTVRPSATTGSEPSAGESLAVAQPVEEEPVSAGADALADVDATVAGLSEFTRRQLQRTREQVASRSDAEQLDELETLARRLSNVSSEESLAQLSETIAPWIGSSSSRATGPDEAADASVPFDVSTAQISDVLKQETTGAVQYVAVMVDAAGRTQQTPLDSADGESLYEVFVLIKKFPLLETVYRKTVIGLLDQLVEQERAATEQASSPADESGDTHHQNK